MKRTLTFISAVLLLTVTATAQEHHHAAADAIRSEQAKVANFLQLTPDQRTSWDALHADLQNTIAPLFDQAQSARQQLSTLLDSDSPDPIAVGTQVIAMHSLEKQIQAAHTAALQKAEALLTPDQKTKFEAWRASRGEGMTMQMGSCPPSCPIGH